MNMSKRRKVSDNILEITVRMYKIHVIVAWAMPFNEVARFCRKRGCSALTPEWVREVASFAEGANGLCTNLGQGNTDVLVWLKNALYRDSKASEYGTLYHELFHAVDKITKSHNLHDEQECRAYLFEYIATECNRFFWGNKRPKGAK